MRLKLPDQMATGFPSVILLTAVLGVGGGLAAWKSTDVARAEAVAASQPEPAEVITAVLARGGEHRPTTTSIGTVVATRSVTLRNELPGTVREVRLASGQVVEPGTILVALDVSVEEAELRALEAQATLAETTLGRLERMAERRAVSAIELDNARAELEIARAGIARMQAVIGRKTIRAPFRARVGIADVHPGQFLEAGTLLTTLQGIDSSVDIDFAVPQTVALELAPGTAIEVLPTREGVSARVAHIVAVDARVDPASRNAMVRARLSDPEQVFTPGASVLVRAPSGEALQAVLVPVSALRRGPDGDHVFILERTDEGELRSFTRRVRVGVVAGDEILILEGILPGERVAASGAFKLREAALVHVVDGPDAGSTDGPAVVEEGS